jgi:hypothetical protein
MMDVHLAIPSILRILAVWRSPLADYLRESSIVFLPSSRCSKSIPEMRFICWQARFSGLHHEPRASALRNSRLAEEVPDVPSPFQASALFIAGAACDTIPVSFDDGVSLAILFI